jgi:3-oxoacyl-[acyl-carrier-protein] synthase II
MKRRVVITGLGIVSPVGSQIPKAWEHIVSGVSGIRRIHGFDASAMACHIAGQVTDFDCGDYLPDKDARRMDTFIHYGLAAGIQAIQDAGLDQYEALNKTRVGVNVGSGIGGLPLIEKTHQSYLEHGPRKISPFFVPASIINMISGHLSIMYGYEGPNYAIVSACTTGTHAIGDAARLIEYGDADVMIAGGAEATVSPLGISGFAALRALSLRNDDPQTASRPWDKDRDGFVLGEGAGVLVLESYEHAKARGARIYAELAGLGMSADAYHMTAPSEGGEGAKRCMLLALQQASCSPDQVDYINAHGTSTPLGDVAETLAIRSAFGAHADRLLVSSTKSMTGHLLGAAGGIEAVFTTLVLYHQIIPPTINLFEAGPGCDLDYVPHTAREKKVRVALSNSFGFGGTNGCLVFKQLS